MARYSFDISLINYLFHAISRMFCHLTEKDSNMRKVLKIGINRFKNRDFCFLVR